MNIEEYISNGILESYALGVCTAAEKAEVEKLLVLHPELKAKLNEIEEDLFAYGQANAVAPRPELKQQILNTIAQSEARAETPVRTMRFNWLAAASIALLVASLAGNVFLYQKYQKTTASLAALESQNTILAQDMGTLKANYEESNSMLAAIGGPDTRIVEMKGVPTSPESKAMVYWDPSSSEVYITVASLPAAPEGMQYQLWAIVDGTPVDAGMIDLDKDPNMPHQMKNFQSAQAFAVTLEKKGGSPTPNLEAMYVIGNVNS